MNRNTITIVILLIVVGASGFFLGRKLPASQEPIQSATLEEVDNTHEIRSGGYDFINPLIECDCFKPSKQVATVLMETAIKNYIGVAVNANRASQVSVYFRDLNNGPWIGIDEDEKFTPASLLKVLVMIAAFKKAEEDPFFLKKKLKIRTIVSNDFNQNLYDTSMVIIGRSYTVEELLNRAIRNSDNEASANIWEALGPAFMSRVFEDVQVKVSGIRSEMDNISVREYSSFFRILYNASYLSKEMSERALKLLTQSTFNAGLVAGLPKDVTIAHKFGERKFQESTIVQLHDCGIVYTAQTPYLICVMTRGTDFKELSSIIADISAMVYKDVNHR